MCENITFEFNDLCAIDRSHEDKMIVWRILVNIYLQFEDKVKEEWTPPYLVGTEDLSK